MRIVPFTGVCHLAGARPPPLLDEALFERPLGGPRPPPFLYSFKVSVDSCWKYGLPAIPFARCSPSEVIFSSALKQEELSGL